MLPPVFPSLLFILHTKTFFMRAIFRVQAILCLCLTLLCTQVIAQQYEARILDAETRQPIEAAAAQLKKSRINAISNSNGRFLFTKISLPDSIQISALGYQPLTALFNPATTSYLLQRTTELTEVVVQTGYQSLDRRTSTGSAVTIGNEVLSRVVSSNLLERLEGVTPGLVFNRNIFTGTNQSALTIRGRSTLLANPNPLIVVDNFPFDGDLSNINPNDVETVTVLKDAAAASIWGALAGNGVIVITTKKGRIGQAPTLSFTMNTAIQEKPDLWYAPHLGSSEYVDMQSFLYGRGYYTASINSPTRPALPQVVDILVQRDRGAITAAEAAQQLDNLRQQDVRKDLHQYYFQPAVLRQYAFNLRGGGSNNQYFLSAGLDKNQQQVVGNENQRITVNANNTYQFLNNRVELNTGVFFTQTNTQNNGSSFFPGTPYLRLADDNGQALPVANTYNLQYVDTAGQGRLLDWKYRPLDELRLANNSSKLRDYRINTGLKVSIIDGLSVELRYQYSNGVTQSTNLQGIETFFTRDMINRFTQINRVSGQITRPVPLGGIVDQSESTYESHNTRVQGNYRKNWSQHSLQIIAGAERRQVKVDASRYRLFGYNPEVRSTLPVDLSGLYPLYNSPASLARIPNNVSASGTDNRFLSWFSNIVYTLHDRYTFSASLRKDASNLFGINANQRGVPLYSIGANWGMHKEKWFKVNWLSALSIRASYGYNGNVDNTISAQTAASFSNVNTYGQIQGIISSAPNPNIRWEKIGVINAGIDFSLRSGFLNGSIEYFRKQGTDLIGNGPMAPQAGITTFRGNSANMITKGMDLVLNFFPLQGKLRWESNLLVSYAADRITKYQFLRSGASNYVNQAFLNPLEGKPLYSILSYAWRGLDPLNGDPQGFLNGQLTKNYSNIINSNDLEGLVYNGPAFPQVTGSTRNTITWKGWSLSALITGKFGYYFRRPSIFYSDLFSAQMGHPDYNNRWQQPGDENKTQVPSLIYPAVTSRDAFYRSSEQLIEKGDHIRLQDIQLSYTLSGNAIPAALKIRSVKFYVYASNLGLLWRANGAGMDPDYIPVNTNILNIPPARSIALGANINF